MPTQRLLTTAQVAAMAKVDVSTVLRAARSGRLTPAMKVEGRTGVYLFTEAAARRYVEALLSSSKQAS